MVFESNKARELLKEFGLEDRMVDNNSANDKLYEEIDYTKVNKLINLKRDVSINLIKKYILSEKI